jgi:predicted ATP-dependent endonuclease of OLD family
MKITKLTIHNFLKLKDVEVDPSKVNVIIGKNKQGKTSILKAIQVAFTGKADEKMIHDSETKAEITIDLDDYKIERSITRKGNYLTVENKDGWQVPAPQKFLDGFIGQFSFNPIEFFNLKSADKKKYLLQAIDIRLTPEKLKAILGENVEMDLNRHGLEVIAELYKHYYGLRTQLNATVSKKEKTVAELSEKLPANFDRKETGAALAAQIDILRRAITNNETEKERLKSTAEKIESNKHEITRLDEKIAELQKEKEQRIKANEEMAARKFDIQDTAKMEKELAVLESRRELIQTAKQIDDTSAELVKEQAEQARIDSIVKRLGKEVPDQLIKEANLPVEGLKVEEDSVSLNGKDIENLSASEQLTFALQVVRKLNSNFKIICIDGVEVLDKETFAWFVSEIEKDDFQYFVTRVDGEKGLLVEDGKVTKK